MGYNTTLLILNDAIGEIDRDPAGWWKKTREEIRSGYRNVDYGFGSYANGFRVIANDHADQVNVIAVGGNYASILGTVFNGNRGHHLPADQVRILREVAAGLGYRLVKDSAVAFLDPLSREVTDG